ncbi:hypothetical protein TPHA_0H02630 [Tetrapisispora phaffii CBS 4417]|uniref:non-specific serine/threonine protein kinase n=1 Tax=Tetrapisispora phaffii (strain ATCC 24235 / CBS 4417 / NBRC 1672 / NRRL Y-8282 / UCD 70-5) TaxID=1071381 RepID=G8BWL5_TETPH|nr:hypothetical protein TPHA_0H02630 [Tetrapisispora phaffii CBS 4417]CCE64466.1 hypothetical protein TPHA_0H02630 [Tetrapisispora phaffii CBS 4417]
MPYIGGSDTSRNSFQTLREKHSILNEGNPTNQAQSQFNVSEKQVIEDLSPPNAANLQERSNSLHSLNSCSTDIDMQELMNLPNESTHVYSYNPLSPNSLAVRLKILKRSLEILIGNPDMLKDPSGSNSANGDDAETNHSRHLSQFIKHDKDFLSHLESYNSSQHNRDNNTSYDSADGVYAKNNRRDSLQLNKHTTHSATLQAFVTKSATATIMNTPTVSDTNIASMPRATSLMHLPSGHSSSLNGAYGKIKTSNSHSINKMTMHKLSNISEHETSYNNNNSGDESAESEINSESDEDNLNFTAISISTKHRKGVESKKENIFYNNSTASQSAEIVTSRISDLVQLLDLLNETLENNLSAKASALHNMSLLNINKLNIGDVKNSGSTTVTKTLLDSLAEPFFELLADERSIDDEAELKTEMNEFLGNKNNGNAIPSEDNESFTEFRPQQDYGRLLHTFTSIKNSAPHAIFTCSEQYPWQFRAANDLSCLSFGISRNAIKALSLLDLIHPDNRDFVCNKILGTEGRDIVFTGEIVAIVQPGGSQKSGSGKNNLIWASIWAKRKNNLLVCVFEKVPCDYMDLKLNLNDFSIEDIVSNDALFKQKQSPGDDLKLSSLSMEKELSLALLPSHTNTDNDFENHDFSSNKENENIDIAPIPTKKKSVKFANEMHDVSDISLSLSKLIKDVMQGKIFEKEDKLYSVQERVANHINRRRYFTINHLSYNIPCAVSAIMLEKELKLKVHSLPYEAGLFIIDTHTLQLITFNRSIAKNMFGLHFSELAGEHIDTIIPLFSKIISYVAQKYSALDITNCRNKGLVLTEHFFRKIQAEMDGDRDAFYTSVGIDGLHRDGCSIKIDFQLRVVDPSVAFVWITHSRDVVFEDYNSNPSQLQMLNESELAFISSNSSSASSSKKSTLKINIKDLSALSKLSLDNKHMSGETITSQGTAPNSNSSQSHSSLNLHVPRTPESVRSSSNVLSPKTSNNKKHTDSKGDVETNDNENIFNDSELRNKLELANVYVKDKSQFINSGRFTVDEGLIKSMATSPISSKSASSLQLSARVPSKEISSGGSFPDLNSNISSLKNSPSELKTTFLHVPENQIGSQKRTKKFSDFVILQKMGEGAYGKVNLCLHKKKRYIVVIKMIFKERILVDTWVRDRQLGTIPSEIQIMTTLNKSPHENIMQLLDFFEDDDYYYIETPLHGETGCIDLFDLIEFKSNMTESEARLIFIQVVLGIKHLHDSNIVHRDVKDENVIVDAKGFVKLIDFGSAAYVNSGPFDVFVGTIDYAAPEVLSGEPYLGKPQDIWAIGILLYTIMFKENPFYNIDEILEAELKINNTSDASQDCIDLIKRILTKNPNKRPTIDEIVNDKWLKL